MSLIQLGVLLKKNPYQFGTGTLCAFSILICADIAEEILLLMNFVFGIAVSNYKGK